MNEAKIPRILENKISAKLFQGKTIVLIGARQAGKTTLIREILTKRSEVFVSRWR
jgi:hypothetical protein